VVGITGREGEESDVNKDEDGGEGDGDGEKNEREEGGNI